MCCGHLGRFLGAWVCLPNNQKSDKGVFEWIERKSKNQSTRRYTHTKTARASTNFTKACLSSSKTRESILRYKVRLSKLAERLFRQRMIISLQREIFYYWKDSYWYYMLGLFVWLLRFVLLKYKTLVRRYIVTSSALMPFLLNSRLILNRHPNWGLRRDVNYLPSIVSGRR